MTEWMEAELDQLAKDLRASQRRLTIAVLVTAVFFVLNVIGAVRWWLVG